MPLLQQENKRYKVWGTNMSKAVLVIDAPKSCDECQFIDEQYHFCAVPWFGKDVTDYIACRHPECPLKPLPEKQELTFATHGEDMIAMGWNAAIEAIENDLK